MQIYNESGECERVGCLVSHADADESCDHLPTLTVVAFAAALCGTVVMWNSFTVG